MDNEVLDFPYLKLISFQNWYQKEIVRLSNAIL